MVEYDIADPNDPNTLVVPFIFVPHGSPLPVEWLDAHPGWVRFPATMVSRGPVAKESGPQWNMRIDFPDDPEPADPPPDTPDPDATAMLDAPVAHGEAGTEGVPTIVVADNASYSYGTTASALAAWRKAQTVFADPMGAAGMRRVTDVQTVRASSHGMTFGDVTDMLLGIGSARAQSSDNQSGDPTGNGAPGHLNVSSEASAGNPATSSQKPLSQQEVTARLQQYTTQAAEEVDAKELDALTPAQTEAALLNPRLYPMFRGTAIDRLVRDYVATDPLLADRLLGKPNAGPDFMDKLTGAKYDMTTNDAFPAHQSRPGYGDDLIHLDTGSTRPIDLPDIEVP